MLHKRLHRKLVFYRVTVFVLLIGFFLFFLYQHHSYMELCSVNDDLIELVETNREGYEEVINDWCESYSSLQSDYGHLLVEHEELKKESSGVSLPEYSYSEAQVELLALCVQCEAGEKNLVSQRYITAVILNRVKSGDFPNTIEEVIYQKVNGCVQFSVAYNGMMDNAELSPTVLANVYSVIVGGSDLPDNVMYFYSASLKEDNWVKTLNVYDTVEGTVFAYE